MMLLNGARGETSFQAGATMKKFNLVTSTNEDVILHDDLGSANCTISREDSCTQTSQSLAFKPNDLKRCLEASVDSNSFAQNFNFTAEEPARMKGNYEVDLENLKQDTMIKQQSFAMAFEAPAHLSEAQVKELGPVLLVIDQYHMECLLSRQWLLRDKALHFLESNLQSKDVDDDLTSTFRAAHKILIQALNDKVSTVFHTSLQALVNSFEKAGSAAPKDRASSSIDKSSQDSECQKCLQAVPESKMGTHTKSKECRLVKGQKMNHCPLCRNSVQPGDLGWRAHLLGPPGCAKNSRTKP